MKNYRLGIHEKNIEEIETIQDEIIFNPDELIKMKCKIDFNYASDLKFNGQEIEDIGYGLEYTLSFRIDQEHRNWGIKSISVYDVQGPEELDVEVVFYPEGSEDPKEEYIIIKVDWDSTNYEKEQSNGMIGIDRDVEMELVNDSEASPKTTPPPE